MWIPLCIERSRAAAPRKLANGYMTTNRKKRRDPIIPTSGDLVPGRSG